MFVALSRHGVHASSALELLLVGMLLPCLDSCLACLWIIVTVHLWKCSHLDRHISLFETTLQMLHSYNI